MHLFFVNKQFGGEKGKRAYCPLPTSLSSRLYPLTSQLQRVEKDWSETGFPLFSDPQKASPTLHGREFRSTFENSPLLILCFPLHLSSSVQEMGSQKVSTRRRGRESVGAWQRRNIKIRHIFYQLPPDYDYKLSVTKCLLPCPLLSSETICDEI